MDPRLDEKVVVTAAREFMDIIEAAFELSATKEAFGPSKNEGLCYETAIDIPFGGDFGGHIYICMDGYTKMNLLPAIAEWIKRIHPSPSPGLSWALCRFGETVADSILNEISQAGYELTADPPLDRSHKLTPIDLKASRQYITIIFLEDARHKKYLGRFYLILLLNKFMTGN